MALLVFGMIGLVWWLAGEWIEITERHHGR